MTLLGLDLNATCGRAVHGPVGDSPLGLPLEPPFQELPMVLSLANHAPLAGHAGLRLLRTEPHLTCHDFLAHLGKNGPEKKMWQAGRHKLDCAQALAIVWQRLAPACAQTDGVVLVLPSYLSQAQAYQVRSSGIQHRAPLLGSVPSLLAAALTAFAERTWTGSVVVIDVDDHALSMGVVRADQNQARLMDTRHFSLLGLKIWKERLINTLADRCVLQSRRDPRDVPLAEQALFEQLDALLDASLEDRMIQLGIQSPQWYQNLLVRPEQTNGACAHLARQVVQAVDEGLALLPPEEAPSAILLSARAGRLPGLAMLLRARMEQVAREPQAVASKPGTMLEDFGEQLMRDTSEPSTSVFLLAADAPARAAHALAAHFQRGDLPPGHLNSHAPLPLWTPAHLQY